MSERRSSNLVVLTAEDDDIHYDQPCAHGERVDGHAVYCTNDGWNDRPRKCRRTWYTGGETRDEDCEGYAANPALTSPSNAEPG